MRKTVQEKSKGKTERGKNSATLTSLQWIFSIAEEDFTLVFVRCAWIIPTSFHTVSEPSEARAASYPENNVG